MVCAPRAARARRLGGWTRSRASGRRPSIVITRTEASAGDGEGDGAAVGPPPPPQAVKSATTAARHERDPISPLLPAPEEGEAGDDVGIERRAVVVEDLEVGAHMDRPLPEIETGDVRLEGRRVAEAEIRDRVRAGQAHVLSALFAAHGIDPREDAGPLRPELPHPEPGPEGDRGVGRGRAG